MDIFTHSRILSSFHLFFNRPKGRGIYPKRNKNYPQFYNFKVLRVYGSNLYFIFPK